MTRRPGLQTPLTRHLSLFLLCIGFFTASDGFGLRTVSKIPRVVTIFHGFDEETVFSLVNHASVLSAGVYGGSTDIRVYVPDSGPRGTFWDKSVAHVSKLVSVPTWNPSWDADRKAGKLLALKLAVLSRDGGIVMDSDVLLTKEVTSLLSESFVIGDGATHDLCADLGMCLASNSLYSTRRGPWISYLDHAR